MRVEKEMQGWVKFFTVVVLGVQFSVAWATPFNAAFLNKTGHGYVQADRTTYSGMPNYSLFVESNDSTNSRTAEFKLPYIAPVFQAADRLFSAYTSFNEECYLPEGSRFIVRLITSRKITGWLHWPAGFQDTSAVRCSKGETPNQQQFCSDNRPASVRACSNGSYVAVDLTKIVDPLNQPVDPRIIAADLKQALDSTRQPISKQ